jgi:hypothetical protein
MEFSDDFTGTTAGPLHGRVATTGETWGDLNGACQLDGAGHYVRNMAAQGGTYGAVDLAFTPRRMRATVSWTGASTNNGENDGPTLIASNTSVRDGIAPTLGIFHNASIHAVFGRWATALSIWENDASVSPDSIFFLYPNGPVASGVPITVGVDFWGDRIRAILPDGTVRWAMDERFRTYHGPHTIWQCWTVNTPGLAPRFHSVWASSDPKPYSVVQ